MVAAQYLAQFKAGSGRTSVAPARFAQGVTVTIGEWDGSNRHAAKWRVEDNVISELSLLQLPGDSIEHRGCRRGAQQYFRIQCRDWTRRAEKSHYKETCEARRQACEVAHVCALSKPLLSTWIPTNKKPPH